MPKLSVVVPTHDMEGKDYFFKRCMESLWLQSFQDFEIVVSDNSEDDVIKDICAYYFTGVRYSKNPRKGMAPNTNEAMKLAKGNLIKILYMDDFLNHQDSLGSIVKHFKGNWLVTDCLHFDGFKYFNHHIPEYNNEIHFGKNTIGSPSVLTIKNEDILLFDENMTWLLDCDLYKRLYERYGAPKVLNDRNVVIGVGEHQATNVMGDEVKLKEHDYMIHKYA